MNSAPANTDPSVDRALTAYKWDTLVDGRPAQVDCVDIDQQRYRIGRGPLTILSLFDEWYDDVRDPGGVVKELTGQQKIKPDLFTFWQRVPDIEPKYDYHVEYESIAALPISGADDWFNTQISSRTRSLIRKGRKQGVEVRTAEYDDSFVRGMTEIFNESPVRQGRPFWHYGKDFETVKRQFSAYLFREQMIGAYYNGEMIGFIMLGNAGKYGLTGQIISKLSHRDKSTNNLLIAKAVEICGEQGLPYLVYFYWTGDSLAEFKRRCAFQEFKVPRYFVPLTARGRLALRLGVHRGWKSIVPAGLTPPLKKLRSAWNRYTRRNGAGLKWPQKRQRRVFGAPDSRSDTKAGFLCPG